ncbi:unnamed protein product [Polarella glacialis]|uniref:Uncharacterized protein n=1 Tax=Polarella glacialis TaxID=89957 RepID=A0A813GP89_POLGL|nr:unnamed protein product [Polarella glacialis]
MLLLLSLLLACNSAKAGLEKQNSAYKDFTQEKPVGLAQKTIEMQDQTRIGYNIPSRATTTTVDNANKSQGQARRCPRCFASSFQTQRTIFASIANLLANLPALGALNWYSVVGLRISSNNNNKRKQTTTTTTTTTTTATTTTTTTAPAKMQRHTCNIKGKAQRNAEQMLSIVFEFCCMAA